jgi:type VI secretion system protein VasG
MWGLYLPPVRQTMANVDLKALISTLNPYCNRSLEGAAAACVNRGHYEVTVEHFLLAIIEDGTGDLNNIFLHFGRDPGRLKKALQSSLESFKRGNTGRPVFSPFLIRLIGRAWMIASIDFKVPEVRSGILIHALLENPARYISGDYADVLETIGQDHLKANFFDIVHSSAETRQAQARARATGSSAEQGDTLATPGGGTDASGQPIDDSALGRYGTNFTQRARLDNVDPVFGRDREIRQIIDILARRRKNNPIIVGEAGVGKTALAEGLALRIVEGDVPDVLAGVELIGLDLGLLQAGAGVKGEFEARLKQVIDDVKASPKPIILFIDEAHMMIGAGASEGGSDAANLLKPALARGELRTLAATTWTEYKKYFEKDAALSRRFQLVKLEEPSVDATTTMLRGLRKRYEADHGVIIRDDALVAASAMGARYISGRYHPDKGIDLVDTAAARVRVALTTKPAELEDAERLIETLDRELQALRSDAEKCAVPVAERVGELIDEIAATEQHVVELTAHWRTEADAAQLVLDARQALSQLQLDIEETPAKLDEAKLDELRLELRGAIEALRVIAGRDPLVNVEVTPEVIGRVISDWTGIPLGKMVRDEASALLSFESRLGERIKGQDHALESVATRVRAAKAGLKNPRTPIGVFLFVGPSGVGKTETALGVADQLFGGERFMTTINMSEFQEKHTVARLIGSPPGYIGYGEGGVLTEAVRQRPYSVVLLDEVEKAHPEVLNLFYQVFDKGMLSDGEGRVIDFKDTVVFLTSNLASDLIMQHTHEGQLTIDTDTLVKKIRPVLSGHFKPALLARMTIVPFYPINPEVMVRITRLKLGHVRDRLWESHKMGMLVQPGVVQAIADRCNEVETGARNIDHIINGTLLPRISTALLTQMASGTLPSRLRIGLNATGDFSFEFYEGDTKPRPGDPLFETGTQAAPAPAPAQVTAPVPAIKPVEAAPEPVQVATPEPVVAAPEPVVAAPEPVVAAPEPVVVAPEPEPVPAPEVVPVTGIAPELVLPAISKPVEVATEPPSAPEPRVDISLDVHAPGATEIEPEPTPEPEPAPKAAPKPKPSMADMMAMARSALSGIAQAKPGENGVASQAKAALAQLAAAARGPDEVDPNAPPEGQAFINIATKALMDIAKAAKSDDAE